MPVYTTCPTCQSMFRTALMWAEQYPKCCVDKGMGPFVEEALLATRRGIVALDAGDFATLDELEDEMSRIMIAKLSDTTGALDRVISEMKIHAKRAEEGGFAYDEADVQTLKHHAEDMIAMGEYVLRKVDPDSGFLHDSEKS